MRLYFPAKVPYAELTYGLRLQSWLKTGATLASATWTVPTTDGALVVIAQSVAAGGLALVKLGGGTVAFEYMLQCRFLSSDGERDERDVYLKIIPLKPQ